jgi:lysophospholipase L1-like esterase
MNRSKLLIALLLLSPYIFCQVKIMPLGDSITKGIGGTYGGYRGYLLDKVSGHSVEFVGNELDGVSAHEGHPGWTSLQLKDNLSTYLGSTHPDIVLLHIGTNDISGNISVNDIITNIQEMINIILGFDSSIEIYLAKIIDRADYESKHNATISLNSEINGLSNTHVHIVDMYDELDDYWDFKLSNPNFTYCTSDPSDTSFNLCTLHPNDTGYKAMATAWYNAIESSLPVELTSFNASTVNNKVRLKWRTETEVNNYGFEIQRNGKKIGFVAGYGNTNSPHNYSFEYGLGGKFRLKQIDSDGTFSYSKEIEIALKNYQNYPNPFNTSTIIPYEKALTIYNSLGEKLIHVEGESEYIFNGNNFPGGVYFYETNNSIYKMVLLK